MILLLGLSVAAFALIAAWGERVYATIDPRSLGVASVAIGLAFVAFATAVAKWRRRNWVIRGWSVLLIAASLLTVFGYEVWVSLFTTHPFLAQVGAAVTPRAAHTIALPHSRMHALTATTSHGLLWEQTRHA